MEETLKQDVLKEIREGDGRLLLHDEVETKPGTYEIIPIWEAVDASDVMTPKELYETVTSEEFQVDYQRVAVVSIALELRGVRLMLPDRRASTPASHPPGDHAQGRDGSGARFELCVSCSPFCTSRAQGIKRG